MRALAIGLALTLAGTAQAQDRSATHGAAVYARWCAPCHGAKRIGTRWALPATASLEVKYKGAKPAPLEQRTDLPAPLLKAFVRGGSQSMPAFRKTEVSDADIEAVAAYLAQTSARPGR
ncbi:MAG: cytochrome c [Caulobacteraceae bacterium]